jgi:hypothetical protein
MDSTFWHAGNDGVDSGSDADLIFAESGNIPGSEFQNIGVVTGLIVMWYGTSDNIPTGWHICNGEVGTRDLRDKFVLGAGNTYEVGDQSTNLFTATGTITIDAHIVTANESASHQHPFSDYYRPGVQKSYYDVYGNAMSSQQTSYSGTTSSSTGGGSGHEHSTAEGTLMTGTAVNNRPFYYALIYIQKI